MKSKIIIVGRDGRPSMRKVYSQMKNGELIVVRTPKRKKRYIRKYNDNNSDVFNKEPIENLNGKNSVVIRWGNRIEFETNKNSIVYNKAENIYTATNKKLSREIFIKNKVSTPKLYNNKKSEISFPIIARPLVHSKGKNFLIINTKEEFNNHFNFGWYYSEFIDKEKEFRVHCAHGKILAVMEKPRGEGIAWNRAINHERFTRILQKEYNYNVCIEALKAVKAIGLDFAGVDVILKDGKAYVLEVNTAPTLNSSEYVSSQYAKYFDLLFNTEGRVEHWDFINFKKAESLAWKQNQLIK